jgi:hypothetical protein
MGFERFCNISIGILIGQATGSADPTMVKEATV